MKAFLLITSLMFTMNISAQGFETTLEAPNFIIPCSDTNFMMGMKVKEFDNSYFLLSRTQTGFGDCVILGGIGYTLTRVSESGDTIYNKLFMHPDVELDSSGQLYPIDFAIGNDSMIYVLGEEQRWGQPYEPVFLAKHDLDGQHVWKQNYPSSYLTPETIFIDDSTLFIAGKQNTGAQLYDVAILQLDTAGVIEWTGYAQNGYSTQVSKIVKRTNDYVVIGKQIQAGSGNNNYRPFIVPFTQNWIDTTNSYYYGNPNHTYPKVDAFYSYDQNLVLAGHSSFYGSVHLFEIDDLNQLMNTITCEIDYQMDGYYFTGLAQTADSNFAIVGERVYVNDFGSGYGRTISFEKFDENGIMLINTEFAGNVNDVISVEEGEVLVAGARYDRDLSLMWTRTSLLLKLDEQGLTPDCSPHYILSYYYSETTDSLTAGGVINVINNSEGEADNFNWEINGGATWLFGHNVSFQSFDPGWLTLSLVGCGQEFSDSIFIVQSTSGITENPESEINIYPNPVTDELRITGFTGSIEIFSIEGKKFYQTAVNSSVVIESINWMPGIYTILFRNSDSVESTKIIKY